MAERRPLVIISGQVQQLPSGDSIPSEALGTGTADGTKFLRDDGTWQTPSGGGGSVGPSIYSFAAAYG